MSNTNNAPVPQMVTPRTRAWTIRFADDMQEDLVLTGHNIQFPQPGTLVVIEYEVIDNTAYAIARRGVHGWLAFEESLVAAESERVQ